MTKKRAKKPKVEIRRDGERLVGDCLDCSVLGCEAFNALYNLPLAEMMTAFNTIPKDCPLPVPVK